MTDQRLTNPKVCKFCELPIADGDERQSAMGGYGHNRESLCIRAMQTEITQLRGNLSLAEEGLASATQEIAQLQAAGKILVDEGDRHLTEYNAEIERLRKALTSVQNLAGGHPIECECRQCEIFELLEPIVGNISPRSAHEPEGGK